MQNRKTYIICGRSEIHRDQAMVARFTRTLAECLFGHECAAEMILPFEQWSIAWVKTPPDVVRALNNEVTHLTGKTPAVANKEKSVAGRPSTPYLRPISVKGKSSPATRMFLISTGMVTLKVGQFCQLIHSNPDLERSIDCDTRLRNSYFTAHLPARARSAR